MRQFRDLTTKEKKEYLVILLLLPFAYIGHLFRKANFRTFYKRGVAVCLALVMIAMTIPIMSICLFAFMSGAKVAKRFFAPLRMTGYCSTYTCHVERSRDIFIEISPLTSFGRNDNEGNRSVEMTMKEIIRSK